MTSKSEKLANVASNSRQSDIDIFKERLLARLPEPADGRAESRVAWARSAFEFFSRRAETIKIEAFWLNEREGVAALDTAMPDCPFIVDSTLEYFRRSTIPVRMLLHPVYSLSRDSEGAIVSFERGHASEHPESFTHAEIELVASAADLAALGAGLKQVLTEVHRATSDFGAMTERALEICDETAAVREFVEIRDFLRWLVQGGLIFLGYRRYRVTDEDGMPALEVEGGSGLGILHDDSRSRYARPVRLDAMDQALRALMFDGPALIMGKTYAEAHVHRRASMDDITVRISGPGGEVVGFERFLGLLTSKAYAEEAQHIPVLRAKLGELLSAEGAQPGSHDYKELVAIFNSFPKEELFRARAPELRAQIRPILDVNRENDVRLSIQNDPVRQNVIALVIMPREHFSAAVRLSIQAALGKWLRGRLLYYYLALGESYTARLHFCFAAPAPDFSGLPALQAAVVQIARTWEERLCERLCQHFGASRGHELAVRWTPAFPAAYKSADAIETALADIEQVEAVLRGDSFRVQIRHDDEAAEASELRMYELGEAPILSELVPVLQNFGICVFSEDAYELRPLIDHVPRSIHLQAFRVGCLSGGRFGQMPGTKLLAEALVAVRTDQAEDDALNALTLEAGLTWREVALLRAYTAAAFQMELAPSRQAVHRPLLLYPELAGMLVEIFKARFDPDHEDSENERQRLSADYLVRLGKVENIADDRFARALLGMIEATVRTNYFRGSDPANPYIALKFESAKIPNLLDSTPLFEIHVNSPRMEGCHLRAGRIARGGIRYSDRPDDYRTEILDLMKTQTVKNAIIVPMGSKGGFIPKARGGRAPGADAVVSAYKTLINAMLDLTDNVIDGRVVHPERVAVRDNDGPYLVVAADKGTAAFSDIANEIAENRGFWLGDAFASGGRHGYDHKKLGITARGAWESARRHLREMGRDLDHGAPITIVGIGDMSGDVFGNGLLQSSNLKLIAAFDHRDIFLDPDPDPAASFEERKRLYEKSGSRWADYTPTLISLGGGVFRRGQKRIVLSPEIRAALKCDETEIDSDNLVKAILRAGVDMLYNGGIGTYVRASGESDIAVGDHANDNCRIAAAELRCEVVVEGGNLGLTQRARIEYALGGGRINTDAIDNSAGVDTSDHEVNLKILMRPAMMAGVVGVAERNRVLAASAEDVAASVLRDNHDQVLSLSLEQIRSRGQLSAFREHLTAVQQRGFLRRHETVLPTREALSERRARYAGLTRPELALLTAYTKIDLVFRLEHTPLIDDPYLERNFLEPYFPPAIVAKFEGDIPRHGLHHELITTRIVNAIVDLMGSTFIFNLTRDFGIEAEQAVRAWLIAAGVLDLHRRCEELKGGELALEADAEIGAFLALDRALRRACGWAVENIDLTVPLDDVVNRFRPALQELAASFENALRGGERARFERSYRELRASVHQEQLAHEMARLDFTDHLLNILSLSFAKNHDALAGASVYFGLSERIEFAMLERAIEQTDSDDRWERRAAHDLSAELTAARTRLCAASLDRGQAHDGGAPGLVARGGDRYAAEVERVMDELRPLPAISLPALQVAVRALSRMAEHD
ncbi:MAG: NAD-glutamate dehydrogenase domain-containing protein [Candidatus Binataceae bacterium]